MPLIGYLRALNGWLGGTAAMVAMAAANPALRARVALARLGAAAVLAALCVSPGLVHPAHVAAEPGAQATGPKAYIGLFQDNAVAVLDSAAGRVLETIPVPAGPHGLVITPDGRRVYVSSDGDSTVSVIDTATDRIVDTINVGDTPHGLGITPDGSRVLVTSFGTNRVLAIDTAGDQVAWQAPVPQPHNVAITADGRTAYVASQQAGATALVILDVASGAQIGTVQLDYAPRALTFSPDGTDLIFTLAGVDAVQVLDLASGQLETQIPVGASPHYPLFTPDGKLGMVVSQGPGTLDLFDPATYTRTGVVPVGQMPHWIATTADSRTAYVTNENSNSVSVVDLTTGMTTASIPVGNGPRQIVLQRVAAASAPMPPAAGAASTAGTASPSGAALAGGASSREAATPGASVTIAKFAFAPAALTVQSGQPIVFTNGDPIAHTTTGAGGAWDSGAIAPGASYTLTLDQPGTYSYHCSIHPFMQGTITVTS